VPAYPDKSFKTNRKK